MAHQLNRDTISALVLMALAWLLYLFLIPTYVVDAEGGAMSPRFFPRIGAVLIGLGGLALLLSSLLSSPRIADAALESGIMRPAMVAAALAGFVLLFQSAGYLYAAPMLIAVLMLIFGARSPMAMALVAIVTSGVLYGLFGYVLNLPLE